MRSRSTFISLSLLLAATAYSEGQFASDTLLVKVKPGQSSAAKTVYKKLGATVVRSLPQIGWETIRLKSGMALQKAQDQLNASKAFAMTEVNHISYPLDLPNDPMVPAQYSLAKMQLSGAWSLGKGDSTAIVAIVDTGVDVNHPDLRASCIAGYDTADGGDTNVMGTNPHGTHCAGIAAATGDNGVGIAGIAYGASIMPIKVFPDGIDGAYDDAISAGIIWATDHGANVISMSLGGPGDAGAELAAAMDYAYAKNVVIVAAAGNSNVSTHFTPASYPKCIAVGASDQNDLRASFSNYGADWVDVAAPGVGIRSTVFNGLYEDYNGTSMACPNVAGLATLIISYAGVGTLTNDEVRALIENNCDPVGPWIAHGRVNAYKSMLAMPLPITDAPIPATLQPVDGSLTSTDPNTIMVADGFSTTMQAVKKPGLGMTSSASTSFTMSKLSLNEVRTAKLSMNVTADSKATIQVYLKDASGKWSIFATQPGTGAATAYSFKLDNARLAKSMVSNTMEVLVRTLIPTRLMQGRPTTTVVDQLQVSFSGVRSRAKP